MKKKIFSLLLIYCVLIPCFLLSACGFDNKNSKDKVNDIDSLQNEISDVTPTYTSITESVNSFTSNIKTEQVNTTLPNEYNSNIYSISTAGNYYFSGNLTSVITVAKNSDDVHIFLDNVTLSVEDKNAISLKAGSNVVITLIGNNFLTNTGTSKHIIDSKENLTINGNGTLTISSTKSAIACDKTFFGLGGTINVLAQNHAVAADSIYIDGLAINAISCGKDILHAESDYDEVTTAPKFSYDKGFVYIISGTINSTSVLGDGIQADSSVYIKDGIFNLTTTPTWNNNYKAIDNQEKGMFNTSTHQKVSRDSVRAGSTYAILEESVKGIKVGEIDYYLAIDKENELKVSSSDYTILIEGGTFDINTVDDAIHTNSGSVLIYSGDITIETSDDGIHADTNLKIAGDSVINIQNSYEGIEAQTIEIAGGSTTVFALDDGVNAANGNLTENQQKSVCQINISGGRLDVTVNPNGDRDGIDSNGGIKITGGVVITRGPNNQNACPLDSANAISVTGGTVIVIGCTPMSGGRFSGPGGGGPGESSFSTTLTKTQTSSKGLSKGSHVIVVDDTSISYSNEYSYSGYTTVYANKSATIN